MSKNGKMSVGVERLDEVLAIYGVSPARWPEVERDALSALIGSDSRAARLHGEAVALDKVMSRAPAGKADASLRNRIVAAAVSDAGREARVVPISAGRGLRSGGFGFGTAGGAVWSATALAACFALGLYLGVAGMGANTIDSAINLAALDDTAADDAGPADIFSDSDIMDSEGLI